MSGSECYFSQRKDLTIESDDVKFLCLHGLAFNNACILGKIIAVCGTFRSLESQQATNEVMVYDFMRYISVGHALPFALLVRKLIIIAVLE